MDFKDKRNKKIIIGLVKVSSYPEWPANILTVPKKGKRVIMCVECRNLNKAIYYYHYRAL